jgi:hypothetical protein
VRIRWRIIHKVNLDELPADLSDIGSIPEWRLNTAFWSGEKREMGVIEL